MNNVWFWRLILSLLLMLPIAAVLLVIYLAITANGMVALHPDLEQRVCKLGLPFVHALGQYEDWRKVTVAHGLSFVLMVAVWGCWEGVIYVYLKPPPVLTNKVRAVLALGVVILVLDGVLFFCGLYMAQGFFAASGRLIPSLLMTALYVCVLVALAFGVHCVRHN